jgi:hypothetical protein
MKLCKAMCATCPWRDGSPYAYLAADLSNSSLNVSRICHSTGSNNAINRRTGKPPAICRGSRNVQLKILAATGFISEATDEAWADKCREMGLQPPTLV